MCIRDRNNILRYASHVLLGPLVYFVSLKVPVLASRLAGKSSPEMAYYVSSGTSVLPSSTMLSMMPQVHRRAVQAADVDRDYHARLFVQAVTFVWWRQPGMSVSVADDNWSGSWQQTVQGTASTLTCSHRLVVFCRDRIQSITLYSAMHRDRIRGE